MFRYLYITLIISSLACFSFGQEPLGREGSLTVESLNSYLTKGVKNDSLKVLKYFDWITQNIAYDESVILSLNQRSKLTNSEILKKRKAICSEYASLFQSLCALEGINAQVVTGYVRKKPYLKLNLDVPDHAWNAVYLNRKWYLIDLTWAAGIKQNPEGLFFRNVEDYFLSSPKMLIESHLPALPFWQLLSCPIQASTFAHSRDSVLTHLSKSCTAYAYRDSIDEFLEKSKFNPILFKTIKQYKFLPSTGNKKELAQVYIDIENAFSDEEARLQTNGPLDSLIALQQKMFQLCKQASELTTLFSNQAENCAYTQFNLGVSLYQMLVEKQNEHTPERTVKKFQEILFHFESAQNQLEKLPQNILVQNALDQLKDYITYIKESIKFADQKE